MAATSTCVDIPVGFYFHPKDSDLLSYYLRNKVLGKPFKYEMVVPEINLYGTKEPWEIWNENGGQNLEKGEALYFFTKVKTLSGKKVSGKGKASRNMARAIGSGTWKVENSGIKVKDNNDMDVGLCKRFHYENRQSSQNDAWIMHEYSLIDYPLMPKSDSTAGDDDHIVLCRMRKNDKVKKRKLIVAADSPVQAQTKIQRTEPEVIEVADHNEEHQITEYNIGLCQSQADFVTADPNVQSSLSCVHQPHYHVETDTDELGMNFIDMATAFTDQPPDYYGVTQDQQSGGGVCSQYYQPDYVELNEIQLEDDDVFGLLNHDDLLEFNY